MFKLKKPRFLPESPNFDFMRHRFFSFGISLVIVMGSLFLIGFKGLNYGIDFTGGTLMEVRMETAPDLATLRNTLSDLDFGDISIQEFGEPNDIIIRLPQQHGGVEAQQAAINTIKASLETLYGADKVEHRRVEFVGPQVGDELKLAGLLAVVLSIAGIMAYIWFRFEWQFAVAAIAALTHDVIATTGLFALTGMTFDLSSLAAVLMVAGYSVNDTVIIFDRVRENLQKYKKMEVRDLLNMSINQTLSRTLMTCVTTLLALIALLIFAGEVIRDFSYAQLFGVLIGTHSTFYVAAPLLMYLNVRRSKLGGQEDAAAATAK